MSHRTEQEITCPECGNEQRAFVWDSLNVSLDPSLRQRLFDGQINTFKCTSCGLEAFVSVPLFYHDMTRQLCVQYLPPEMLDDPSSFELYTTEGELDVGLPLEELEAEYLARPHVVFEIAEMLRYIYFRELLYERDNPQGVECTDNDIGSDE